MVNAPYLLEDASYPGLRLNLCLASTNNLEVLADASLTTCMTYEGRSFIQVFLQLSTNLVLLKKSCLETNITYHTSLCCRVFLEW